MAESLYSILMNMAQNPAILREATKKAMPKVKKDYDKNVRKNMIQFYLDSYDPTIYKRLEPSPLFLAYRTKSGLVNGGTAIDVSVVDTDEDISDYYASDSYYHQDGSSWNSVSDIHSMSGKEYMLNIEDLRDEYGYDNGSVSGSWILDNFEKGIHPRTNGWPKKKYVKKMKYVPKKIRPTPLQMAERYADEYFNLDTSYQYVLVELDKIWNEMF